MSEHGGEKTEQPTAKRLEEAIRRGQLPRSAEVQTVVVLLFAVGVLVLTGREAWNRMAVSLASTLGHLHETPVTQESLQGQLMTWVVSFVLSAGPVVLGAMLGGLLAGAIQSRFQTSPDALEANWERVNPMNGFKRIFSTQSAAPALLSALKLGAVLVVCSSDLISMASDPIFHSAVDTARIASFLSESAVRLMLRVCLVLGVLAALDYGYQYWRNHREMMMTKEELKEELKSTEGNPQVKAARKRRKTAHTVRKMMADVPKADVIVTNPTHLSIALKYDRRTMKAPKIIAKGSRLNALRIREIARAHQVPIVENKPLARMMFKYGKVGGEVPAQLYAAVAEVLAWVYRVNRYKYYVEQQM